ncbi:hypothetical protein BGX27_005616 [Mortierella sp. AM989]|nr:hypothetical protein BGX27_005616 [Mortierella sp. AM989]
MAHQQTDDDFGPSVTNGYKPGQKKTMDEYQKLDADDDALKRWKESLGVTTAASSGDDPHNVVVLQLALEVAGRPDVVLDLTQSAEELKKHSFTIKEGVDYRIKVLFKVQHSLVSGLKYMQVVKRKGIPGKYTRTHQTVVNSKNVLFSINMYGLIVDKNEEMIGSYAAKPDIIEKKASNNKLSLLDGQNPPEVTSNLGYLSYYVFQFAMEEAPSGMLARGHYDAKSKFVDDDGTVHKEWSWSFDIKKDW